MESPVLAVRLRRDRIVIVLNSTIYVYSFSDIPSKLFQFKTWFNPKGLSILSVASDNSYLAFPSNSCAGTIEIVDLSISDLVKHQINAHHHELFALAFNSTGICFICGYFINVLLFFKKF